jgi:hypothetical protein
MSSRKTLEIIVVALWMLIAVSIFMVDRQKNEPAPDPPITEFDNDKKIELKEKIGLKKIIVISANSFDLTLKDEKNTRILAKLDVVIAEEAKQKIIDLLNTISNPQLRLIEKQNDGKWVVDLSFDLEGQEQSLKSWLEGKNLVYKN